MIELAPGHKQGLPCANPVWLAGGMIGNGDAIPRGLDMPKLGGVVVGPILARSQAGVSPPRMAESIGGMVLESGWQNRGVGSILARQSKLWPKLGCPVVAQLADSNARSMAELASRVASLPGLAGLELVLLTQDVKVAARMAESAVLAIDLPVWVKLPLSAAVAWSRMLADSGVSGLVIGQPVRGQLGLPGEGTVNGGIYGPLTFAQMLPVFRAVAAMQLPCAVIACGGIHSYAQVDVALKAGASAVQIDSAVWVEPALPNWIVKEWEESRKRALPNRGNAQT